MVLTQALSWEVVQHSRGVRAGAAPAQLCQPRVLLRGRNRGDNRLFIPWQLGWSFPILLSDSMEIPKPALQELSSSRRTQLVWEYPEGRTQSFWPLPGSAGTSVQ